MLKEYLFSLWEAACQNSDTESHIGFVGGAKNIKDKFGNILQVTPKDTERPAQITPFYLIKPAPFMPINMDQTEFNRLMAQWQAGWEAKIYKPWNNENTKA